MQGLIPGPREGWLYLILLVAVVLTPALSLADSAWVEHLQPVPWFTLIAILLGFAMARLRVRGIVAHLFALELGAVSIGALYATLSGMDRWKDRVQWLGERVWVWLTVVFGGGMSNDSVMFALLMSGTGWLLGYLAGWLAFKHHIVWPTLVACGSALLVNLSYGGPNQLAYFLVFLLAAMLLLSRLTLYEKQRDWDTANAQYTPAVTFGFLWRSAVLSALIVVFAWAMPTGAVAASVAEGWYQFTGPWHNLQLEFDRVFASVGSSTRVAEGNRFTNTLALKGAIELGDEPVMLVASPSPEYWGTRTYDRYTSQGWLSSANQTSRLDADVPRLTASGSIGRQELEQHYRMLVGGGANLFAAGDPLRVSIPTYAEYFDTMDIVAWLRPTIPFQRGQQYGVVSSVSVAGVADLRSAGTDYPAWTEPYLELPSRSLARVRSLAREITLSDNNPYDAAVSIEQYLRGLSYSIDVAAPPPNRDAVDWFLFISREGYCDYFASAMAVMARTLGIPSRIVSGYNTGTLNEAGVFVVKQENAHSWPELFFPEFGWVRFEPTPSQPVPDRAEGSTTSQEDAAQQLSEEELAALSFDVDEYGNILLDDDFGLMDDGFFSTEQMNAGTMGWTLFVVTAIIAAASLLLWLAWRRFASALSDSGRVYLQMYSVAGLLGWKLRPSSTPSEYSRILGAASPDLRPEVDTIVRSYVEEVYGGRRPEDGESVRLSWLRLRSKLPLRLLKHRLSKRQ
jgi:transglutaminase-like putative cysteine protease